MHLTPASAHLTRPSWSLFASTSIQPSSKRSDGLRNTVAITHSTSMSENILDPLSPTSSAKSVSLWATACLAVFFHLRKSEIIFSTRRNLQVSVLRVDDVMFLDDQLNEVVCLCCAARVSIMLLAAKSYQLGANTTRMLYKTSCPRSRLRLRRQESPHVVYWDKSFWHKR